MRRWLVLTSVVALLIMVVGTAWLAWALRPERVRDHVNAAVSERFAANVDIASARVSIFPRPTIDGTRLRLRLRDAASDAPPLISVNAFQASAPFTGLVGRKIHFASVNLAGADIRMPSGGFSTSAVTRRDVLSSIVIDEIVSRDARLELATRNANKLPRVFEVHDLVMQGFGLPEGARFQAGITNAIPRGRVETTGVFGPWLTEHPTQTPLRGEYVFRHANLNDIRGISGTLSSVGQYRGTLERIEVDGQTESPDFALDLANQPVPLFTRFKAIVDGTNGDTWLDRVDGKLGESAIAASGAIVRDRDVAGRHVALDVRIHDARIEDVLRLAVKADRPPMTGRMELTSTLLLAAGGGDVIDRLRLDGQFRLAQARFTNIDIQRRIEALSLRARGQEDAEPTATGSSVVSNLRGRFVMRGAKLDFSQLTFTIPGAEVHLAGVYDLRGEALDFKGELLVESSLADMTSGFKALLARLAQPFFRRPGGGSRFPIRITGPRSKPEFGLDVRRVLRRG